MHDHRLIDTVLRMGELLGAAQGLAPTLDAIVEADSLSSIGVRGVAVFLTGKERQALRLVRHRNVPESISQDTAKPIGSPKCARRAAKEGSIEVDVEQQLVAIPLRTGSESVGVLALVCAQAWTPSRDQRLDLQALGNVVALALVRARAQDREKRLRAKIEVIREASAAINEKLAIVPEEHLRAAVLREFRLWPSTRDEVLPEFLQSVLQTIVEHATEAAGAQFGALGVGESPGQPFEPWVFTGVGQEQAAAIGRHPRPVGTLGIVAAEGQVVRTADVRTHPAFKGFPSSHPEVTSLLGVPIRYRGANLGNLYLGNKLGATEFDDDDLEMIELLALQATLSLQHAYFRAAVNTHRGQLQIIWDSAPHGLLFIDAHSGDVVANPRAMQLLGRPIHPAAGRAQYLSQFRRVDGQSLEIEELPSSRAMSGHGVSDEEFLIVHPDGRQIPVLMSAAPVRGLNGGALGAVVSFEDVSTIKELERYREEFAALVAHDLRDPIQGILFQIDLLLRRVEGGLVHAPVSLVRRIETSAQRLGQMTHDLLDASRIELRRLALDQERLDVADAVRDLVARIRPTLADHPVEIQAPGEVSAAWLDPLRFDQIVTNLLDNAAKFSDAQSRITIRLRASEDGFELAVEDRGIGIPGDELPRLFDRFYQARRARERKTGLGLGLYITKGLVEAHGGRLWVESEPGRGSTFHAWFPPRPGEAPTERG